MKFVTEEDLRDLYKENPFTSYEIQEGAKLTPGARQFLADRGMNLFDDGPFINRKNSSAKHLSAESKKDKGWKKFYAKLDSTEAMFLLVGEEFLCRDVCLAQSVIRLGKQLSCIRQGRVESFCCKGCTGITTDNFSEELEDCFEIEEFHIQTEKGKEMIALHRLRCALREVTFDIPESCEQDKKLAEEIAAGIHRIVNTLSQMICTAFGGKECQKKV